MNLFTFVHIGSEGWWSIQNNWTGSLWVLGYGPDSGGGGGPAVWSYWLAA